MNRRALSGVLVALALVAAACSGGSKDDSEEDASRPEDSTTLTTAAPTTTSTTAVTEPTQPSVLADASGLGGVALGYPAGDLIERLTVAFGPPTRDTGFIPSGCDPGITDETRYVSWSDLEVMVLKEQGQEPFLQGWVVSASSGSPAGLEIRPDLSLGMAWAELASRGAAWDSPLWQLDGLYGYLGDELAVDDPPDDSLVTSIAAGSTGGCL